MGEVLHTTSHHLSCMFMNTQTTETRWRTVIDRQKETQKTSLIIHSWKWRQHVQDDDTLYTIAWRHMTRGVENNSGYWNLSLSRKIPTCVRHLSVRQDDIKTINFDMKFHSKELKDVGRRSSTSVILLTALTSDATSYSAVAVQISIVTVATLTTTTSIDYVHSPTFSIHVHVVR